MRELPGQLTADELAELFEGRTRLVQMAPLRDPDLFALTIARALGVREMSGISILERIATELEGAPFLLCLDNLEHLLAAAPVVAALLRECPTLKILATSRAPLNLTLEHRPDVVVMDIGLPDLDGLEAIRRIVRARPQARVMVLTAHDDDNMRKAARDAGAMAYVVKSASTKEISDAVRALARGETMLGKPEKPTRYSNRVAQLDTYFQSNQPDDPILTKREQEVLQLFANGKSTVEVARALTISQKTVKNHLASIYQKLNVRDRTEAVLLAVRMGIIKLERRTRPRL